MGVGNSMSEGVAMEMNMEFCGEKEAPVWDRCFG